MTQNKKQKRTIKLSDDLFPAPETVGRLVGGSHPRAGAPADPGPGAPAVVAAAPADARRPTTEAEAMEIILPARHSRRLETSGVFRARRRVAPLSAGDKGQRPGHSQTAPASRTAEKPGEELGGLLGPLPAVFGMAMGMTLLVLQSMSLPWRVFLARDGGERRR